MTRAELKALVNGLIALCQREGILSTETDYLATQLRLLAADEIYIEKQDIIDWLEG